MTDTSQNTASKIEQDIQHSRARVADTLHELRQYLSPGQVVDEVLEYAKQSGGAEFTRNVGRSVTQNPLPLLLVGTGIAWLMRASNGRPQAGPSAQQIGATAWNALDRTRRLATGSADSRAADAAGATAENVRDAGEKLGQRAGEYAESAKGLARDTRENVEHWRQSLEGTWNSLAADQPLVLGAMGVALGALLGAGLPSTRTENRLMGKVSDEMKGEAKREAGKRYEGVREGVADNGQDASRAWSEKGPSEATGAEAPAPRLPGAPATSQQGDEQEGRMAFQRGRDRHS